jgi:dienelactone hydrolase
MKRFACTVGVIFTVALSLSWAAEPDPTRVLPAGKLPEDSRLGKAKTLNDYFPFTPPSSKEVWETRRQEVRERVLVANGLWPMPEKTPLQPVIHGKIDRDDYTIEKVFFASYAGHYVSGNLYRPKGKTGKLPGVLSPHGHWPNGRFFDALTAYGEKRVQQQLDSGAEKTVEGARFPLQARCAQLARMGCVVFHYDMVGNADSQQIKHREGFTDAEAELRLQSFMGLQTYNSIRALDFLLSLPEVDAKRIGVTGASGGGTQTFILCAIDDRPAAAFPAVMVSTAMQGGCICENCSYLRQNTGNVELAALFAPKPLGMSGANDWTKEIETKGLPQLKELYRLYGLEDWVMAKAYLQFDHNYNQVSRELMYNWFNKSLLLGQPEPVVEKRFMPVPPKELSVYDEQHPRPPDATDADGLRNYLTTLSHKQIAALMPKDATGLAELRRVLGTALRVMIGDRLPAASEVEAKEVGDKEERDGLEWRKYLLSRKGQGEAISAIGIKGPEFDGTVVLWVHPAGKASLFQNGKLVAEAQRILDKKAAIFAPDVFLTGEFHGTTPPEVNQTYAGYTFGYNRPLLANRVHDILTAVAYVKSHERVKTVHLVGLEQAGPWVLLARALCGDAVARTASDFARFRFENVRKTTDEMMLPGALKYGGLPAFAALCAPGELFVHNDQGMGSGDWLKPVYKAAGAEGHLHRLPEKASPEKVVDWLLR